MEKSASKKDEVLQSIANAAARINNRPAFHPILSEFQKYPKHKKEKAKEFRVKLKGRGFGWLV